jgi:probable phosphoglycerate mutase
MSQPLPQIYLARHGETAWTISGQHTGRTDIPLTERGERNARSLGARLAGRPFAAVYTSPLQRARRTCELAGYSPNAQLDPDLMEWNYGAYEGRMSADIRKERPGWCPWRDGFPGGETLDEVGARANRVVARLRAVGGDVILFSHAHFLRVLAAAWLGAPFADGRLLLLTTASLSILGYEHGLDEPVLRLWNDASHQEP